MSTDSTEQVRPALPQIMPTGGQVVAVVPQSVEEIFRVSKGVVQSGLAPYALTGKIDSPDAMSKAVSAVAIVIMAGAELGLPPMVSLRSFTAINGRPALYGDGLINVVRRSGRAKKLRVEYTTGTDFRLFIKAGKLREPYGETPEELADDIKAVRAEFMALDIDQRTGGYCDAERADNGESKCVIFTVAQAKRAGLWQAEEQVLKEVWEWNDAAGKKKPVKKMVPNDSPWFRYPERMLGWRAAGFCLRDLFGDVLGGITDDWEAREIAGMIDVSPQQSQPARSERPSPPPPPPEEPEPQIPASNDEPKRDTPADIAGDFNDDDSGVSTAPEVAFVPSGKITGEVSGYLADLKRDLLLLPTEAEVNEAFDLEDVQEKYADNQLAMAEAFKVRDEVINALATKQRETLEASGQGRLV
jgi:hypothetical protein